jgi:putative tricarboxylic transport membrane protein
MGGGKGEAIAALVLLALASAYTLEAMRLPGVKYAVGPGPSFLPVLLGTAVILLSLILLARAVLRPSEKPEGPGSLGWAAAWRIGVILLALAGYAFLFERLGYLLSTVLFLAVLLAVVGQQPWWVVVSVPVASSVLSYLLFVRALKIPFPRGPLGF